MDILFVGTERVGCHVQEVSGMQVSFTGYIDKIEEAKRAVLFVSVRIVIIDLNMFADHYTKIADTVASMSMANNARYIFYYLGKNSKSALVRALVAQGFRYFVMDSIQSRANDELQKCLDGYATVELSEEEAEEPVPVQQESTENKKISVAVAGCLPRIGTTTQAIQIVKYLLYLNHRACYVQMNNSRYVENLDGYYADMVRDDQNLCLSYSGVDMYPVPEKMGPIRSMDYEYFVYDFGDFNNFTSNTTVQFLDMDIRVVVGGSSPPEMIAMSEIFSSPIFMSDVYYIFSFVPDLEKDDVADLMAHKKDHTVFAGYTPDPFTYSYESDEMYDIIISAKKVNREAPKKRGLFSKRKGAGRHG